MYGTHCSIKAAESATDQQKSGPVFQPITQVFKHLSLSWPRGHRNLGDEGFTSKEPHICHLAKKIRKRGLHTDNIKRMPKSLNLFTWCKIKSAKIKNLPLSLGTLGRHVVLKVLYVAPGKFNT